MGKNPWSGRDYSLRFLTLLTATGRFGRPLFGAPLPA